ncbi:MAG: DUF4147 domain-containing protein, partial [Myxococcales bacterium]
MRRVRRRDRTRPAGGHALQPSVRHVPERVRAGPAHDALRGDARGRDSLFRRRFGRRRRLTSLRDDALTAWRAGVRAADGAERVARYFTDHPRVSDELERTLVVATGKVAVPMAAGVGVGGCGFALAPHPGAAASSTPAPVLAPGIELLHGGHPVPDAVGVESSRKILDAVSALGVGDRLLYLVSGGSSALFEVPDPRIEQADLLTAHDELVRSGANIAEINSVRRALSRTKGGRLAAAARPASVLTLAISDVAGDDPAIIGSGPTVAPTGADRDGSTAALEIIRRYRLESVLAPAVLETLARPEPCGPANVEGFVVLASVATACAQARCVLEERGYRCVSPPDGRLAGDASDAARTLAELARTLAARPERLALVLGGETTPRVP